MDNFETRLEQAFVRRKEFHPEPCRIFHGPTEGIQMEKEISIDWFPALSGAVGVWITIWDQRALVFLPTLQKFLREKGVAFAVLLDRSQTASDKKPECILGTIPQDYWIVQEGPYKLQLDFSDHRHPGLFLDLRELRDDLVSVYSGQRVLNLFCFTGSLSLASKFGRPNQVTSIDLSKSTIQWAKRNWELNSFPETDGDFIYGDVFEWLKRFEKKQRQFELVISDPPSFSRAPSGTFSTAKDLQRLHEGLFKVLAPDGLCVSVINSENVAWEDFEDSAVRAAGVLNRRIQVVKRYAVSQRFTGLPVQRKDSYLKGLAIRLSKK